MNIEAAVRRFKDAPLIAHAVVLGAVLLLMELTIISDRVFVSDEGAYAIQVRALEAGGWEVEYLLHDVDPSGTYQPYTNAAATAAGTATYAKQPSYVYALRASYAVFGRLGLRLLPIAGAVAAGVAAWMIAGELGVRSRGTALWLTAVSPVVVANGFIMWAHSWGAALAGFSAVAACRLVTKPSWAAIVALAASLAASVLIRGEALLWAGALCAVVGVVALRRRSLVLLGGAVASAGFALGAEVLQARWVRTIVVDSTVATEARAGGGITVRGETQRSWVADRVAAFVHTVLHESSVNGLRSIAILGGAAAVGAIAYVLRDRVRDNGRVLIVLTLTAASFWTVVLLRSGSDGATGLLAAWPIVLLGLIARRWSERSSLDRMLLAAVGLFAIAVLLTQYPEGGGLEWGGRFLSPAVPVLAAMTAGAVATVTARVSSSKAATIAVVVAAIVPAVLSVRTTEIVRQDRERVLDLIHGTASDVVVTQNRFLALGDWEHYPDVQWVLLDGDGERDELLDLLKRAGVSRFAAADVEPSFVDGLKATRVANRLYLIEVADLP